MFRDELKRLISKYSDGVDFDILIPINSEMGDYSTNAAFVSAKVNNKNPQEIGDDLVKKFRGDKHLTNFFEKIEFAKPGFINFYFKADFLREKFGEISNDGNYGFNETMKGKTVMVEYTDPNPFKLFHIGHLMSNTIGEAIARLHEASGAKVLRVTWQGDVGMHIAMAVWAIKSGKVGSMPNKDESLKFKMDYLGKAYSVGATAYKDEGGDTKKEIEEINRHIYGKSDPEVNKIYDIGKKWSLDYFEEIYKLLGSKFDRYFFESELGKKGVEIIKQNSDIFEESEGAVIFRGEKHGLHTRVFINSAGIPVYEAKELGLNREKFDLYNLDLSIVVTGNEINEYFRVLLKVMELTMFEVAQRTRHVGHGMLRLPTGKMSSRTGDVITAESLIEQIKSKLPESEDENARDKIAIGAIKYSILKQSPGHDIIFDFDKSLSIKGDSGPYIQYSYARLVSILRKADNTNYELRIMNYELLTDETELKLIKHLIRFPDAIKESVENITPQHLVLYVHELAVISNQFYEKIRILEDENISRRNIRLILVKTVAEIIKRSLFVLGVDTLERI